MSEDLKNIYKGSGNLNRYFYDKTPVDLFRGQKVGATGNFMYPTIVGWYTRDDARNPDVLVHDKNGISPQYKGEGFTNLVIEGKELKLTTEILRNADQYIVKGCRTMSGLHRGVSVFDKKNPRLPFDWYLIPANAKLPDALAVTRDAPELTRSTPIHYTLAPKDDMPLSLFLQYLKSMGEQAKLLKI